MGTRHLTCLVQDKTFRISQYGQFDGYPSGAGITVLDFLHNTFDQGIMKEALKDVSQISEEDYESAWQAVGVDPGSEFHTMEQSEHFKKKFIHLHRECGADILQLVQEGKAKRLNINVGFAQDSLFCEWAYLIDLDKQTFEVYKGFNQSPLTPADRFYSETTSVPSHRVGTPQEEYQPIKLVLSYPLGKLPTQATFLEECKAIEKTDS